jgi:hypothetical protein
MDVTTWKRVSSSRRPSKMALRDPACLWSCARRRGLLTILAISNAPAFSISCLVPSQRCCSRAFVYVCPARPIRKSYHLQSHKSFLFARDHLLSQPPSPNLFPPFTMSFLSPNRLRAKIAPHLTLRVPFTAGIYENSPRWSNKDLDPVPPEQRTWGGIVSLPP